MQLQRPQGRQGNDHRTQHQQAGGHAGGHAQTLAGQHIKAQCTHGHQRQLQDKFLVLAAGVPQHRCGQAPDHIGRHAHEKDAQHPARLGPGRPVQNPHQVGRHQPEKHEGRQPQHQHGGQHLHINAAQPLLLRLQLGAGRHESRLQRAQQQRVGQGGQVVGQVVEAQRLGVEQAANQHTVHVVERPVDNIGGKHSPSGAQCGRCAAVPEQRPDGMPLERIAGHQTHAGLHQPGGHQRGFGPALQSHGHAHCQIAHRITAQLNQPDGAKVQVTLQQTVGRRGGGCEQAGQRQPFNDLLRPGLTEISGQQRGQQVDADAGQQANQQLPGPGKADVAIDHRRALQQAPAEAKTRYKTGEGQHQQANGKDPENLRPQRARQQHLRAQLQREARDSGHGAPADGRYTMPTQTRHVQGLPERACRRAMVPMTISEIRAR